MSNVLTTYNNVENVAAYYDLKPGASISFEAHPDDIHKPIYLLYTVWPDSGKFSSDFLLTMLLQMLFQLQLLQMSPMLTRIASALRNIYR